MFLSCDNFDIVSCFLTEFIYYTIAYSKIYNKILRLQVLGIKGVLLRYETFLAWLKFLKWANFLNKVYYY